MGGKVEAIWTKPATGGVMEAAERAALVEAQGMEGDVNFGRKARHVTVIEKEVFDRLRAELPGVRPVMRRANIMVSGISLEHSRDKLLTLGDVKIRLRGETHPCEQMDEQCPGLRSALDVHWGGGAHGVVVQGGELHVGDVATIKAPVAVG